MMTEVLIIFVCVVWYTAGCASFVVWYTAGCASFVYWWTQDFDFSTNELLLMIVGGLMGPLVFIFGYFIHGKFNFNFVKSILMKKRKTKEKLIVQANGKNLFTIEKCETIIADDPPYGD